MGRAISLREDFDGVTLRRLAKVSKDADKLLKVVGDKKEKQKKEKNCFDKQLIKARKKIVCFLSTPQKCSG